MDRILLRVLTRKSTLSFGRYKGIPIADLVDLRRNTYLRWVYYNFEGLTFTDDILDDINIQKKYHIIKPGKDLSLGLEMDKEKKDFIKNEYPYHYNTLTKIKTRNSRQSAKSRYMYGKKYSKKSVLQAKNQGH